VNLKSWNLGLGIALGALLVTSTWGYAAPRKNTPPKAIITAPQDGSAYQLAQPVTLVGDVRDAEDNANRVAFQWDVDAVRQNHGRRRVLTARGRTARLDTVSKADGTEYDVRLIVTDSGLLRDTAFVHLNAPQAPRAVAERGEAGHPAAAASTALTSNGGGGGGDATPAPVAPAPVANDDPAHYTLGPGDVLHVTFYAGGDKQEDFTGEVSPSGNLTSPLIGDVPVAGATAHDVGDRMRAILARDFFVNPQVLIEVKDFARKVFVSGEVRNPGAYSVQPGLTVMSACTLAGGFTDFAALNRVKLMRSESGKSRTIEVDLSKVRRGKAPDMAVMAGDRIDVPHRRY